MACCIQYVACSKGNVLQSTSGNMNARNGPFKLFICILNNVIDNLLGFAAKRYICNQKRNTNYEGIVFKILK